MIDSIFSTNSHLLPNLTTILYEDNSELMSGLLSFLPDEGSMLPRALRAWICREVAGTVDIPNLVLRWRLICERWSNIYAGEDEKRRRDEGRASLLC